MPFAAPLLLDADDPSHEGEAAERAQASASAVPDDAEAACAAAVHVAGNLRAQPLVALLAHARMPASTAVRLIA